MKDFQCIHQIPEKIGLISDTHDEKFKTQKALDLFREHKIQTILHAGDVINPDILDLFKDFNVYLVFGNCDNRENLIQACRKNKLNIPKDYFCLTYKTINIFLFHGHSAQVPMFREICLNRDFSYIIKGHTHFKEDYCRNHIHVINPGALNQKDLNTCAILDLNNKKVEFYKID